MLRARLVLCLFGFVLTMITYDRAAFFIGKKKIDHLYLHTFFCPWIKQRIG